MPFAILPFATEQRLQRLCDVASCADDIMCTAGVCHTQPCPFLGQWQWSSIDTAAICFKKSSLNQYLPKVEINIVWAEVYEELYTSCSKVKVFLSFINTDFTITNLEEHFPSQCFCFFPIPPLGIWLDFSAFFCFVLGLHSSLQSRIQSKVGHECNHHLEISSS